MSLIKQKNILVGFTICSLFLSTGCLQNLANSHFSTTNSLSAKQINSESDGIVALKEVFDSSVERSEPASFPVNGVIQGWVEALQLMPVGSKWKLFVPSHLAYGERGAGQKIGPNTTLIFEVELLSIN